MGRGGKETAGKKTANINPVLIEARNDEGLHLSSGSGNGRGETDFRSVSYVQSKGVDDQIGL